MISLQQKVAPTQKKEVFFSLTWPWKLEFEEGKLTKQNNTAKVLMKGGIWKQTLQGHTKSLAQDTGSLGQGKGSHGMLSQRKREGPVYYRTSQGQKRHTGLERLHSSGSSHELCRQIPDHRGEPDPQPKEIPKWLGNWGREMNWGFIIFSCSA